MLTKVNGIGKKKEVLLYLKNKCKLQFLETILKPILNAQKKGIYLTIKNSDPLGPRLLKKFVPYLFGFSVDSAEGYKLTGTRPGERKCRLCESIPSDYLNNNIKLRHSLQYYKYHKYGEIAWINKILGLPLSTQMEDILFHNHKYSIMNVENPLHEHFIPNGRNLFQAVQYDMLHTLLKGLLQQIFMWTLVVINICSKKRYNGILMYENNFHLLDARIKFFQVKNSIFPCEPHIFSQGVSPYLPSSKTTIQAASSGVMNATKLEAQKYLSIVFQLMISIGK